MSAALRLFHLDRRNRRAGYAIAFTPRMLLFGGGEVELQGDNRRHQRPARVIEQAAGCRKAKRHTRDRLAGDRITGGQADRRTGEQAKSVKEGKQERERERKRECER